MGQEDYYNNGDQDIPDDGRPIMLPNASGKAPEDHDDDQTENRHQEQQKSFQEEGRGLALSGSRQTCCIKETIQREGHF